MMDNFVSKLCSLMGIFALLQTLVPPALRDWLDSTLVSFWDKLFQTSDPYVYMEVEEKSGLHNYNALYREVGIYLSSLRSSLDKQSKLKVFRPEEGGSYLFSLPYDEPLVTSFEGVRVWWTLTRVKKEGGMERGCGGWERGMGIGNNGGSESEEKSYTLKFLKAERHLILPAYLDHISKLAAEIEHGNAQRHIHTNNYGAWESSPFNHPSSFDTLALEANLVDRIKADLDAFSKGEDFYHKTGRAWKRGYLLYGPPGTGKTSMIAAIANYLKFDVYDLELTKVFNNSELKSLLIQTARKSIIVIEDIDCTVHIPDRPGAEEAPDTRAPDAPNEASDGDSKLTLSGLLNFTDGLWSCCGEERIFIFTTNNKDRLDFALLRPGRMDLHLLLSYCSFAAVKKMAFNYLGIQDHQMLTALQRIMKTTSHEVTPATVAELLISKHDNPDAALKEVMALFQGSSTVPQEGSQGGVDSEDSLHFALREGSRKKGRRGRAFSVFRTKSKGK